VAALRLLIRGLVALACMWVLWVAVTAALFVGYLLARALS
jgi:hypothetical protein